jgi:hypothetical protein
MIWGRSDPRLHQLQKTCGKACAKLSNGRYGGRSHCYSTFSDSLKFVTLLKTLAFHMQFAPFFGRFVAILFQDADLAGVSSIPTGKAPLDTCLSGPCVISYGRHGDRLVWDIRVQL